MTHLILTACFLAGLVLVLFAVTSRRRNDKTGRAPRSEKERAESSKPAETEAREEDPPTHSDIRELSLPRIDYEEDEALEPTKLGEKPPNLDHSTLPIFYDREAIEDEPTHASPLILVSASGQTDRGLKRKRNEDSLLVLEDASLFVVADGMGGYNGGAVASRLAVETIQEAFRADTFPYEVKERIPKRAGELARAVQLANRRILEEARRQPELKGMGTTVSAARFSPNKQRLYIAHVGDSRVYRLRDRELRHMTNDHTMQEVGVSGETSTHLSRAVGIAPAVRIDVVFGKPLPGDVYLLCSDGLNKMVTDEQIREVLLESSPREAVKKLIDAANESGGKDNVTVIVISVRAARAGAAA
jgi:protein phosphatase